MKKTALFAALAGLLLFAVPAHADGDAGSRGKELGETRLANGREPGEVGDPHRARPRRSDSTSRMRACSVTWPRMA